MAGIPRLPKVTSVDDLDQIPLYSESLGADARVPVSTLAEKLALGVLTDGEVAAIESAISGTFTGATYDGLGRLTSFTRGGSLHTVTYGSGTATISNDSGAPSRTVTFDGSDRVVSIV